MTAPTDALPTDRLIDDFATALKDKLRASAHKPGRGDAWRDGGWEADLQAELRRHVDKGDPLDVAAYCAFAHYHGWRTAPAGTTAPGVTPRSETIKADPAAVMGLAIGLAMRGDFTMAARLTAEITAAEAADTRAGQVAPATVAERH